MPSWITVVTSFAILLLTAALQFYFKWVPDIADQKRHVKRVLIVGGNLLSFGFPLCLLIQFAMSSGPITRSAIIQTVINAMCLVCTAVLVLFEVLSSKIIGKMIDAILQQSQMLDSNLDNVGAIVKIIERHQDILACIGQDPGLSHNTRSEIDRIFAANSVVASRRAPEKEE